MSILKKATKTLFVTALCGVFCASIYGAKAEASTVYNYSWTASTDLSRVQNFKDIKPLEVTDLDNVLYPSTDQYYIYDGLRGSAKFEVKVPTIVRAYYTWDTSGTTKISGQAWVSHDSQGLDIIGTAVKLTSPSDSVTVFLDPGVYYVNHTFSAKQDKYSVYTRVGVALLAQTAGSEESVYASCYPEPNSLKVGEAKRGFLSDNSPNDYYKFKIKEFSKVNISYNFESTGGISLVKATCTLYDADNQKITSKKYNTSGKDQNQFEKFLEPGTYYVELSGATAPTNILVEATNYEVDLSLSTEDYTNKGVNIKVKTDFEYDEILIVNKKVIEANIAKSTIWSTRNNEGCVDITDTAKFKATANGTYTVRVRDGEGDYFLQTIKVSNIDTKKPTVNGVENGKTYTEPVTIKFTDTSGSSATLNGKDIDYGKKVKAAGSYELVVTDGAGNVRTVNFKIK